ncbi:site-specific integrase [Elongatibacter sediminis]|uniref:Site-specific integrase n=1 Tax=Elongatibacter sediminis TaxID=3119006 RepID=A0AAW9RBK8_9GAMM
MPKRSNVYIDKKVIDKAKPRASRYEIRDSALPGFMLRVSPNGSKLFYVQLDRRLKRRIGDAAVLTITRARELALDKLQRYEKGEKIESRLDRKYTLQEYIKKAFGPWAKQNLKRGDESETRLLRVCEPLLATQLDDLTEIQIERWKARRAKSGLSPSTVKRDLAELKSALNKAVKWGYAAENPARNVKVKAEKHTRVRYLSSDERSRLRAALRARDAEKREGRESGNEFRRKRGYEELPELGEFADYLHPLVLLLMNTGLRRSEALSLRWNQVHLGSSARLTVLAAHAKSGKTRHIPLNSGAVDVLTRWGEQTGKDGLVFPSATGGQITTIKTAWGKLMKNAQLEDFRLHDLRHDFASQLVMNGIDLYRVKELLGHGTIEVTQRYAHLAPHTLAEAVEAIA